MAALLERLSSLSSSLSDEAAELAGRVKRGVVAIRGEGGGSGSGIIWQEDGTILTNHHVVSRDHVEVALADGRKFEGQVYRRDPELDLAALRIPALGLPAVPVGDSRGLRTGELVLAVGNPLGVQGAVTMGIVSAPLADSPFGGRGRPTMLQAAVALYPGNSGGPLVDARGRVVGINAMVAGPGMALAVPSHVAQQFLKRDVAGRAYLGTVLHPVELPRALLATLRFPSGEALMVFQVVDGSPADRAGILPGDLLVALEGHPVMDAQDLARGMADVRPGQPVRLGVIRAGSPVSITVVPEELRQAA